MVELGLSVKKIYLLVAQITIAIIGISNCTVFGKLGNNLYYIACILVLTWAVIYGKIDARFLSKNQFIFLVMMIYNIYFGILVGADPEAASTLLIYYFLGMLIYIVDWNVENLYKIIKILQFLTFIIAISIILEAIIPDVMLPIVFMFTSGTEESLLNEIVYGAYSGFAGEKADAAFYMNILFLITVSSCIQNKRVRFKDFVLILVALLALMLTGKRTLFVTIFIITFFLFMSSEIQSKGFKICIVALIGAAVIFSVPTFLPQTNFLFERLGDTSESGRNELWGYAIQMFKERPLFGNGLGSYNKYIFDKGYLNPFTGGKWYAHCHCIYLQILGELGIIGSLLVLSIFISNLKQAFFLMKYARYNELKLLARISVALQLLILVYGITGNTLYYPFQIVLYCLFITIGKIGSKENNLGE